MPVTLADVARRAGVSTSAVSRVLNNKLVRPLPPQTVERIRHAAADLQYVPNRLARGLATRRTYAIGFCTREMTDPHGAVVLDAIESAARERGYSVLVSARRESLTQAAHVDGLIVLEPPVTASSAPPECPVVYVYPSPMVLPNTIGWSDEAGGREAALHLAALGHRRVAGIYATHTGGKAPGFRAGAAETGMQLHEYVEEPGSFSFASFATWADMNDFERRSGYRLTRRLLREHPETTAIFARNDVIAVGVLRALREAHLPVPERVSVMGYLDIHLVATSTVPPLTSVRTPIAEAGRIAVARLIDAVEKGETHFPGVHLPPSLVIRESTGTAPPS